MSERTIELEVLRYRPEQDQEPFFQTYKVPCEEEWVVLDALNYVKEEMDRTLSYRWSCHMFVCGSCGMMIDGEPKLACKAFLKDYPTGKIRVEPLSNFPIERDLVVVLDDFVEKLESVSQLCIAHLVLLLRRHDAFKRKAEFREADASHQFSQLGIDVAQLQSVWCVPIPDKATFNESAQNRFDMRICSE